jgi:DNA polymerase-3 subunit beta
MKKQSFKFIISSGILLKALQEMKYCIGKNTVLPILEDVLFSLHAESNNSELTLTTTDLENSSIRVLDCEANEDFSFAVPYVQLVKFISSLECQPLTFTYVPETLALKVLASDIACNVTCENGDDFPRIPKIEEYKIKLTVTEEICSDIKKALAFVGKDSMRPAMTGVCISFREDKKMCIVSTDAHSLFRAEYEYEGNTVHDFILPALLCKQITDEGELTFSVETNENGEELFPNVSYVHNNAGTKFNHIQRTEISRIIDAPFPQYDAVIPTEGNSLTFSRDAMQHSLKQLIPFSNKNTAQINLALNGCIAMTARDLDFSQSVEKEIPGEWNGEDLEIAFNGNLLSNLLKHYDSETVTCEMTTDKRAAKFIHGDRTYILMPIQID